MARSAVIIIEHEQVALIKRVRAGRTYYVFPGGGIEGLETPEEAAIREAGEELGLVVAIDRLFASVTFEANEQYYYLARRVGGDFGTGHGAEMASLPNTVAGSYTPIWITLAELSQYDVRPRDLVTALMAPDRDARRLPLRVVEPRSD